LKNFPELMSHRVVTTIRSLVNFDLQMEIYARLPQRSLFFRRRDSQTLFRDSL